MKDLPSQCKSEGSPGHGQTCEDNFGEGLVRLSVNRVVIYDNDNEYEPRKNTINDDVSTQKFRSRTRCRSEILTSLVTYFITVLYSTVDVPQESQTLN